MISEVWEAILRLHCRCGRMLLEPSPKCEWHKARTEMARELRQEKGSVEDPHELLVRRPVTLHPAVDGFHPGGSDG